MTVTQVLGAGLVLAPVSGNFDCGEIFTLEILADPATADLKGVSLVLEFDGAILHPLGVEAGALMTGAACPYFLDWRPATIPTDTLAVDMAALGCSVNGPGVLLRFQFEGQVQGISPLSIRNGVLRDSINADIPFSSNVAQVDYRCPVADESTTWGALKAGYR